MKIATFQHDPIPGLTPRVLSAWVREALEYAIKAWRDELEPKHFTRQGGREYGYKARSKKYMIRKAKTHGNQNPLAFSGDTQRMASAGRITSRGSSATLSIPVPDYFAYVKSRHPDMAKELTTVTPAELEFLQRKMEEFLQAKASAL